MKIPGRRAQVHTAFKVNVVVVKLDYKGVGIVDHDAPYFVAARRTSHLHPIYAVIVLRRGARTRAAARRRAAQCSLVTFTYTRTLSGRLARLRGRAPLFWGSSTHKSSRAAAKQCTANEGGGPWSSGVLVFWKSGSSPNFTHVHQHNTCVGHQFIFASIDDQAAPDRMIGPAARWLRDRRRPAYQPVRGLTAPHRFFRVHLARNRVLHPISDPLSYFGPLSRRSRTVKSPGVHDANDTPSHTVHSGTWHANSTARPVKDRLLRTPTGSGKC